MTKNKKIKCNKCDNILHGVSNPIFASSKSYKIPSRPFCGNLCSGCSRDEIFNTVKSMVEKW